MAQREASHAGSWYSDDGPTLSKQLDKWLSQVSDNIDGIGPIPQPGARVIIAPHAGYAYSGPAAAWAYKSLDLSQAKRIFLLGPSHHIHLTNCALSQCTTYTTPLGPLPLDTRTIADLHATSKFSKMSLATDEDEHSLEMHLPYIHKLLSLHFPDNNNNNGPASSFPPLIPILVGSTTTATERAYGALLAPYLADPTSVFIVSSDFCHWGLRFNYTYYLPSTTSSSPSSDSKGSAGYSLKPTSKPPTSPPIHASIGNIDHLSMSTISSGSHAAFLQNLRETGNTVCGRHPIGVVMAALEVLKSEGKLDEEEGRGMFRFVRYERSSDCVKVADSSVSYASAFAIL
ncbi:MAG: hypothetical protein M1830_008313 [Pleopsidium flavum]|nr:MAG: hypothetical protein M1830_008313 [Pleopsidium flavum]